MKRYEVLPVSGKPVVLETYAETIWEEAVNAVTELNNGTLMIGLRDSHDSAFAYAAADTFRALAAFYDGVGDVVKATEGGKNEIPGRDSEEMIASYLKVAAALKAINFKAIPFAMHLDGRPL